MQCPFCQANKDKVIDSRATDGGRAIRRRRQCFSCDRRFTTYEHVEQNHRLFVIKKDKSRVPFDRQKVITGLEKACYKRPVAAERLVTLVDEVEEALARNFDREVDAIEIGRAVAERLKHLDRVAYVRYASVYKRFRDLGDLLEEVREVIESTAPPESPEQGRLF